MSGEPSFYEVTSLSDCVRRIIPAEVNPVIVREHYEGGLLTIEFLPDPDPNAAMIARDEQKFATVGYGQKCEFDPRWFFKAFHFERLGGHDGKKKFRAKFGVKSKPAITGLTTVHDGKVNGLGFCSDLGHE